jgi:hypothetical protein
VCHWGFTDLTYQTEKTRFNERKTLFCAVPFCFHFAKSAVRCSDCFYCVSQNRQQWQHSTVHHNNEVLVLAALFSFSACPHPHPTSPPLSGLFYLFFPRLFDPPPPPPQLIPVYTPRVSPPVPNSRIEIKLGQLRIPCPWEAGALTP